MASSDSPRLAASDRELRESWSRDGARRLGGEDGDGALVAVEAALDVQRLPAAQLFMLADAGADLPRLAERRHVDLAGPAAADVADHELQGAANRRVGARSLTEDVRPAVEPDRVADGSVDDDERADEVGGGQHAVQVERIGAGRFHRGDDHREVLGLAAGHDGVDGDLLDGGRSEIGRHVGHYLGGRPRRAGEHPRDARLGRRHHRQAVGQALLVQKLERIEVGRHAHAPRRQRRGVAPGRKPPCHVGIVDLRSASRPHVRQRLVLTLDHRRRPPALMGGEPGQRQQVRLGEAFEAGQHDAGPVDQHQRRHRVEAIGLGDEQLRVDRPGKCQAVPLGERGGQRRVVLGHAEHAQAAPGQRLMHPLDQRRGQVARGAVVLEEEDQGRWRRVRRLRGRERVRDAGRVSQRERRGLRSGGGELRHGGGSSFPRFDPAPARPAGRTARRSRRRAVRRRWLRAV